MLQLPAFVQRQRPQSLAASFSTNLYESESSENWDHEEDDLWSSADVSSTNDHAESLAASFGTNPYEGESSQNWGHEEDDRSSSAGISSTDNNAAALEARIFFLKKKTVKQLKDMLRMQGLKVSGPKDELVDRLIEAHDDQTEVVFKEENVNVPEGPEDICFDTADNCRMVKKSALERENRLEDALAVSQGLEESTTHEAESLLELLPPEFLLDEELKSDLMEIVLDLGRRPFAWVNGQRHFLGKSLVTKQHLKDIVEPLHFGSDNRAGINGSLHRISAVRNREGDIVGLTLRVGRFIAGNSIMIADILAGLPNASILICGEPGTVKNMSRLLCRLLAILITLFLRFSGYGTGSGKTSIIRDAARFLSEKNSLVIVDTSCEIGGSGDVPHHCIGLSRRMQVQTIDAQAKVMVEAVQNHTPAVMVIDEIGRQAEVQAALTCKGRGVRIVASAHGNLPGLVRNKALCDLVGGVEAVIVGDDAAKKEAKRRGNKLASKIQGQRRGPPVFDVIIEVKRGQLHEWHVVMDSSSAVDDILRDGRYNVQVRSRKDSGASSIHLGHISKDAHNLHKLIEEVTKSTSMLNSIPVTDDENQFEYDFETVLEPWCCTCPACDRELKSRKGLLNHLAMRPDCVRVLPDEITFQLKEEVSRHNLAFSLNR